MVARISQVRGRRRSASVSALTGCVIACAFAVAAFVVGRGRAPEPTISYDRRVVAEFDVVEVPVPERPVPSGTLLRDVAIRMERYPSHQLPSDIVRDVKIFGGQVAMSPLPGGLPIIASNLGDPKDLSNPVIGKIPPGMRAMTVKVDVTSAVEGWARSGSIVDVLLVEKNRTTVVAERVRVLSTERSTSEVADQESSPIPSTVTLLVTQEQCLAINTAVPLGKIAFALRSNGDDSSWRNTRFSAQDLSGDASHTNSRIGGVVSFSVDGESKTYALVDDDWIPTDEAPSGFLDRSKEGRAGQ